MKDIKTRVTRLETMAHAGREIPQADRMQIIKGSLVNGVFMANDPHDSIDTRRKAIIDRYGHDNGIIYIKLIDRFDSNIK